MSETKNKNIINIKGKDYMTVAGRLEMAHADKIRSITTEVLFSDPVVIKATVINKDMNIFTGISAANPAKLIEKMSPYEVAETSAVGRALGFAGYGVIDSIASADEMVKAKVDDPTEAWEDAKPIKPTHINNGYKCEVCKEPVSVNVKTFSQEKYGKTLCFKDQKTI